MSTGEPYRETSGVSPVPGNAALDARLIASREKQAMVIDRRRRGMSFQAIANELSEGGVPISKAQAHKLFKAWLDSEPVQGLDEHRAELVESARARKRRAERLMSDAERDMKNASLGRRSVLTRMISSQQIEIDRADTQLAKLLGAYAPTKHQVTGADDGPVEVTAVTREEILKRIARIGDTTPKTETDPAPPVVEEPAPETNPAPSSPAPSPEDTGESTGPSQDDLDDLGEDLAGEEDEDDEGA